MITVIAVGKLKERYYQAAAGEYRKRLEAFGKFQLWELPECRLPDDPSPAQIHAAHIQEARLIRAKIPKDAWLCVLTSEGKQLSSADLARLLQTVRLGGKSSLCFVLGSSYGMDEDFKREAAYRLSMGPMTFPHHLARVMLLEQLYRAETILAGIRYHK